MSLKAAPQDYPATSQSVLWVAVLMFAAKILAVMILAAMVGEADAERLGLRHNVIFRSAFEIVFLIVFLKAMLLLFRFPMRFPQTFCAVGGVAIGFGFLFIPIQYLTLAQGLGIAEDANPAMSPLLVIAYLAMFVWLVRVLGNIFMHALELRLLYAIAITFLHMIGKVAVMAVIGGV